jgi:flagellar motor switch protein FliN/FliY
MTGNPSSLTEVTLDPSSAETLFSETQVAMQQASNEGLLDIELEALIQFGSREMLLSELLELGSGDVLELDRLITEPVDLLVGDRVVARGEVVVVGGNFGLHIIEVMAPQPRLENVRCLP